MDYLEIMDFCGYDLEKADAMVRELFDIDGNMEAVKNVMDKLEPKPVIQESR